ncbi:hypothetical protein C8R46DRAFT_1347845 [Mycena filopes]|nr:hypothetical protein C8R46DRAFT_1347845 [Mycena filopes]
MGDTHRALRIAEIVDLICRQLDVDPERSQHLARLAQTSTIFLDPALNLLWRHQGTIKHLLAVMPDNIWSFEDPEMGMDADDDDLTITATRGVALEDWDRFLFYSHRVKSFRGDGSRLQTTDVFDVLALSFPEHHVFPNLQKLYWDPGSDAAFHHVGLFLAPTLVELRLRINVTGHLSIFSSLAQKCPSLQVVRIGSPFLPRGVAIAPVSRFICALYHLESLVVASLDESALSHLAALPRLYHLWLMSTDEPPSLPVDPGSLHFPALEHLELEALEHAPAFFDILGNCSLRDLNILRRGFPGPPTTAIARQFYSSLATHCAHSTLQHLTVQGGSYDDDFAGISMDPLAFYSVGADEIRPLLRFHALVHVSLSHAGGFDMDDGMAGDMARAWPCIESLHLVCDPACRLKPRVTLVGIRSFAAHCPALRVLLMTFSAITIPDLLDAGKIVRHPHLVSLCVAHSPVEDSTSTAVFLRALFPHLKHIKIGGVNPLDGDDPEVINSHITWHKIKASLL